MCNEEDKSAPWTEAEETVPKCMQLWGCSVWMKDEEIPVKLTDQKRTINHAAKD